MVRIIWINLLVRLAWVNFVRGTRAIRGLALPVQERNDLCGVVVADTQVGILTCLYFSKRDGSNGVTVSDHFVRGLDKASAIWDHEPHDSLKIRSNLVAVTYGVTSRAISGENVTAPVQSKAHWLRRAAGCLPGRKLPVIQSVADKVRPKSEGCLWLRPASIGRRARCRSARRALCPSRSLGSGAGVKAQLLAQQVNVILFAGQKSPSRADVVFFRVIFQHLPAYRAWDR